MKIENYLHETHSQHSDLIDSFAYMVASQMAKLQEDYLLLYVKSKPVWCPDFLYKWFLKRFIILAKFKKFK